MKLENYSFLIDFFKSKQEFLSIASGSKINFINDFFCILDSVFFVQNQVKDYGFSSNISDFRTLMLEKLRNQNDCPIGVMLINLLIKYGWSALNVEISNIQNIKKGIDYNSNLTYLTENYPFLSYSAQDDIDFYERGVVRFVLYFLFTYNENFFCTILNGRVKLLSVNIFYKDLSKKMTLLNEKLKIQGQMIPNMHINITRGSSNELIALGYLDDLFGLYKNYQSPRLGGVGALYSSLYSVNLYVDVFDDFLDFLKKFTRSYTSVSFMENHLKAQGPHTIARIFRLHQCAYVAYYGTVKDIENFRNNIINRYEYTKPYRQDRNYKTLDLTTINHYSVYRGVGNIFYKNKYFDHESFKSHLSHFQGLKNSIDNEFKAIVSNFDFSNAKINYQMRFTMALWLLALSDLVYVSTNPTYTNSDLGGDAEGTLMSSIPNVVRLIDCRVRYKNSLVQLGEIIDLNINLVDLEFITFSGIDKLADKKVIWQFFINAVKVYRYLHKVNAINYKVIQEIISY